MDTGTNAMLVRSTALAAAAIAALGLSACQSARIARIDTAQSAVPEPLTPAPAGTVTGEELPPPAGAEAFPEAPKTEEAVKPVEVAAANAPEVTPSAVAGVWSVSLSGQSCKLATPQTKYGQGFRAGPLKCPAPIDTVKSWSASGKQLVLYDDSGSPLARLYASGAGRFDGQTTGGQPITLSR